MWHNCILKSFSTSQDDARTRGESSFLASGTGFSGKDKSLMDTPTSPTERPFSCPDEKPAKMTRDESKLLCFLCKVCSFFKYIRVNFVEPLRSKFSP